MKYYRSTVHQVVPGFFLNSKPDCALHAVAVGSLGTHYFPANNCSKRV